jgi:hypothetical protein
MTTETASAVVGVSAALGSAILQQQPPTSLASLAVPVISAAVGFAASYGILKATVNGMGREISILRHDQRNHQSAQQALLTEALERIARIEGRLHHTTPSGG